MQYLNQGKEVINKDPIHCYEEYKDYTVEFAMQYNNDVPEISESFVNNIKTPEGGTHLTGFIPASQGQL